MIDEKKERAAFCAYADANGVGRIARLMYFNRRHGGWDALWAHLQILIDNPGFDFAEGAF
jgi:hypothetical protein